MAAGAAGAAAGTAAGRTTPGAGDTPAVYRQPEQSKTVTDAKLTGSSTPAPALSPVGEGPAPVSGTAETSAGVAGTAAAAAVVGMLGSVPAPDPSAPRTYLDDMPDTAALAHRVLAALNLQFVRALWPQEPIAVGVFRRAGRLAVVFTTSEAVSLWPYTAQLPAGVLPLDRTDGLPAEFSALWSGVHDPVAKIAEFAEDYPELLGALEAIAVNEAGADTVTDTFDGLVTVQTADQVSELSEAAVIPAVSVSRSTLARVTGDNAPAAVIQADLLLEDVAVVPDSWALEMRLRATSLSAQRRSVKSPDPAYAPVLAAYLLAEAHAALTEGRKGEAGYSIGELLMLNPVSV
jgi:hypothetical protein